MRKYVLDRPARTIRVYDKSLPPPLLAAQPPANTTVPPVGEIPPDASLRGHAPFSWGPDSSLVGRFETAQALLVDVLTYYEIERNVTNETLRSGASLAPLFARPYADHILTTFATAQTVLLAEDILAWLIDQLLQGLEHVERRLGTAVLTYVCNLLLHKEVVHARFLRLDGGLSLAGEAPI